MKTARPLDGYRRQIRRLAVVWLALLILLMLSFGSAYLPLGAFNLVVSLVIAAVKIGLIVLFFMQLPHASVWSRLAGWAALVLLAVLCTLSTFEGITRLSEQAAWQQPIIISPVVPQSTQAQIPQRHPPEPTP